MHHLRNGYAHMRIHTHAISDRDDHRISNLVPPLSPSELLLELAFFIYSNDD